MNLLSQCFFFLDQRYLFLPDLFFHLLNGESYVTVLRNMNSVLFKRGSVPVALLVTVPTATGFYLSILFSRSQVLNRGNCNNLCTKHMFLCFIF